MSLFVFKALTLKFLDIYGKILPDFVDPLAVIPMIGPRLTLYVILRRASAAVHRPGVRPELRHQVSVDLPPAVDGGQVQGGTACSRL